MLGWSINLFRVRGIQLSVHFTFLILLGFVAWEGWVAGGWIGVGWFVATLIAFFTCVLLHELGHSFTAQRFGIRVSRILLMPIGGMAEFSAIPRRPRDELLITFAGPAVNFAIAAILWLLVGLPQDWPWAEYPASAMGFAHLLLHANLLMGLFNLLPVFPMDGGRIARALLAARLPYLQATWIAATIGKVLALAGVAVMLFWMESYLGAMLFAFIFIVGELELRAVQRREREAAYWRKMLAHFEPPLPAEPEPPILPRRIGP